MATRWERVGVECQNCFCPPEEKPMIFRDDPWCSDECRKALGKDIPNPISLPTFVGN